MNQREQYEKETGNQIIQPSDMEAYARWLEKKLSNIPTPEEIQTMAEEYSPLYKQPLQNIAFTDGANFVIEKIKG